MCCWASTEPFNKRVTRGTNHTYTGSNNTVCVKRPHLSIMATSTWTYHKSFSKHYYKHK